MVARVWLVVALGGCFSKPPRPTIDATVDPCGPVDVPSTITFEGQLVDASTNQPLDGIIVTTAAGMDTTHSGGQFSIDAPANGTPLAARFALSPVQGVPAHRLEYQRPFTRAISDVSAKLLSNTQLSTLYTSGPRADLAPRLHGQWHRRGVVLQ